VEQASAAAESLTDQTGQLSGALAVFKLDDTPALAAPAAGTSAAGRPALALSLG